MEMRREEQMSASVCDHEGKKEWVLEILFMIISPWKKEVKVTNNMLGLDMEYTFI